MKTVTKSTNKRRKTFGQQERYEHVTKAIFNERLKCKDDIWLRNIDKCHHCNMYHIGHDSENPLAPILSIQPVVCA